jgi:hypothetical protein
MELDSDELELLVETDGEEFETLLTDELDEDSIGLTLVELEATLIVVDPGPDSND